MATAALFLGLAVVNTVQGHLANVPVLAEPAFVAEIERVQSHLVNSTIFAVGSPGFVWLAFFVGRRSFHQTHRAQETWRSVDGRWLLAEEEPLF